MAMRVVVSVGARSSLKSNTEHDMLPGDYAYTVNRPSWIGSRSKGD